MRTNLGYAILFAAFSGALGVSACSDDGDATAPGVGGDAMGGEPSSSAGSGAGKGGSTTTAGTSNTDGGKAGTSTGGTGGTGTAGTDAGGAGMGGAIDLPGGAGGVPAGMGGAMGDAGAGGAGAPTLEYACTANTLNHKVCSAFAAAACPEVFDCATCVTDRKAERDSYNSCASCQAEFDKYFQCGVDAFETGDLAAGVECVPDYGPDFTAPCYDIFDSAMNCREWSLTHPCPDVWPIP